MTTAYTSLLGLALPVTGELSGTWGDTVNNSITSLLDTSVAGTTNVSTDTDVTLTTTTGAANTARQAILLFSGARTALRTVTAPAQSKVYTVINATTGGFSVKLVGAGPTTGVTIVAGESAVCAWNGSDFVKVSNTGGTASFTNVTVTGTTTLSGLTASTALALDASKNVVSVTNTGTGNNVLSASPTLTGTIDAAALTASGNVTLSGGTANGVAYLNGSKVVTSGSALTFDGTNLGVGAGSALTNITINGNSSGGFIRGQRAGANQWFVGDTASALGSGTGLINFVYGNDPFIWYNGGTSAEQMRLTSTGLGIGTSSPAQRLSVNNTGGATTGGIRVYATDQGYARLNIQNENGQAYHLVAGTPGASNSGFAIYDATAGATRVQLDSSGNLGLGVTPSAWYTPGNLKAFELGGGSLVSYLNNQVWLANNYFLNSSGQDTYINNGAAMRFIMDGAYKFQIAPSGTAGNAITFTQAMTLDASGNLGVGSTSPSSFNLIVNSPHAVIGTGSTSAPGLTLYGTTSSAPVIAFADGTTGSEQYRGYIQYNHGADALLFATAGSERARIDSSGNLLVGTTSNTNSSRCFVKSAGAGMGIQVGNTVSDQNAIDFYDGSGDVCGSITINPSANSTTYNTTSDYRLKNITGSITTSGSYIDSLNPVEGTWKADGSTFVGLIAHEVQEASRTTIATGVKDGEEMQGMDYSSSEIIANLIAEVKSLRKRLADAGI